MSLSRALTAAAAALLSLSACSKEEASDASAEPANSLLGYVPAGTPYVSANLQPVPNEVIDRFLERAQPVLETTQAELSSARARLEGGSDNPEPAHPLTLALLQEFDGKLNRPGLESLGLDLQAPRTFYGLGAFPVFRMGLGDAAVLRATVQRVLDRAGIAAAPLERDGQQYWRLPLHADDAGQPEAALYVAIRDDQLAAGFFPIAFEEEMLAHLLGPASAGPEVVAGRLQAINERFGLTPYGTAELDLLRLADELTSPESTAGRAFVNAGIEFPAGFDEQCRTELRQILGHTPRVYSGVTELTPDVVAYRAVVETDKTLASELNALVADVPAADAMSVRAVEFAFGLRVGAVRDFLRQKAELIVQQPYQCAHFAEMNAGAQKAYDQLSQPIPPLVNNFRGLRLSLDKVGNSPATPGSVQGVAAIHVEQPEMFVGMAQMFLPDLAELKLVAGEPPVQLPATLLPLPDAIAFAALGKTAIGLSLGAGEEKRLEDFLEAGTGTTGTFLSFNYDTAVYLDHTDQLADMMSSGDTPGASSSDSAADEIARAARDAYKAMAGRTDTRVGFTPDGLVVDGRMTFR